MRAERGRPEKAFEAHIGSVTLDHMTYDLQAICNHLNMHWGARRHGNFEPWEENSGVRTSWTFHETMTQKRSAHKTRTR